MTQSPRPRSARLTAVCVAAVALVAAAPAHASRLPARYMPAIPPAPPTVIYEPCPAYGQDVFVIGCYYSTLNAIYVKPGLGARKTREVREHEDGHVVDAQELTDAERWRFEHLVGAPHGHWYGVPNSYQGTEETFADAYMTCRLRLVPQSGGAFWTVDRRRRFWSTTSVYRPASRRLHRQVCRSIARWTVPTV